MEYVNIDQERLLLVVTAHTNDALVDAYDIEMACKTAKVEGENIRIFLGNDFEYLVNRHTYDVIAIFGGV